MRQNAITTGCGKVEGDFRTVKEAAQYLRLCEKQVRRLIWRGELPAYRFGTALRIKSQDIEAYAETRRIHPGLSKKDWSSSS